MGKKSLTELNLEDYDLILQENVITLSCKFCAAKVVIRVISKVISPYIHAKDLYREFHEFYRHILQCKEEREAVKKQEDELLGITEKDLPDIEEDQDE